MKRAKFLTQPYTKQQIVLDAIEDILDREWPNELKAQRIYSEVLLKAMEELKAQYERLFYSDKSISQ